jgi:hypothetical protein
MIATRAAMGIRQLRYPGAMLLIAARARNTWATAFIGMKLAKLFAVNQLLPAQTPAAQKPQR